MPAGEVKGTTPLPAPSLNIVGLYAGFLKFDKGSFVNPNSVSTAWRPPPEDN